MSSSKRIFLVVCLLVLLLMALIALRRPDLWQAPPEETTQARTVMNVSTGQPRWQRLPIRLPTDGDIAAWQEAGIASESQGLKLAEVLVEVGDSVKKGQVLARFAGETVAAELSQARAAVNEAETAAAEARTNARRATSLARSGALSQQQIDQYQSADRAAQARLRSARAALTARLQNYRYTELVAPDDGLISARNATVGAVPGSGTELFRLIRQGRLEWRAEVGADDLLRIEAGTKAELHQPDGVVVPLAVRAVSPTVDPKTRTALVYLDVPPQARVRAGMFGRGAFLLGDSDALTVPAEAVVPRDGFNAVYRLMPDQQVQRVRVRTGRRVGDRVEVMPLDEGALDAQSQVVVKGAGFLADGDRVTVVPDTDDDRAGQASGRSGDAQTGAAR
ncbi:MAG: efflux RND transporter periplasmic adaptor subunit [Lautropia sp.]|nr:efflux RND transporter periplasmic adaptor subunit [Lautropia sp.]